MRDVTRKFSRSSWRDSILLSPLLFVCWWFLGWILSISYFDKHFAMFRLLTIRTDALTYVGLLFAVQIPVFILLLQRMVDLGYLRRLIMPGVIKFREILVSYILLSLFLLASQRSSYYYFPVIALTIISLYTVFITVRVMFDPGKLESKENDFVRKIIKQVFGDVLDRRKKSNDFFEELKKLDNVTHIFLDMGRDHRSMTSLNIRSKHAGLIISIDAVQLDAQLSRYFSEPMQETKVSSQASQKTGEDKKPLPTLILEVRPGAIVKAQATLMRLVLPDNIKAPENSFLNKLRDSIAIDTAIADSADRKLDDLITDFKQQLRDAVDKDSVVLIQQSLEFYELLLDGITGFSHAVADSGYTFADARQEFQQFIGDSVSIQIKSISDILNDELLHSIKEEKQDTCKELIHFLYGELLNLTHDYDTVRAAFTDYSFMFTVSRLIFDDSAKMQESSFRGEVFKDLLFRLKEHTGLLLYNYRNADDNSVISDEQLEQWLDSRMNDARSFLLGTYRKSSDVMFKQVLAIFQEFEKDYRLYDEEIKDLVLLERCNLFVIAAYIHGHNNEDTAQKASRELIDAILSKLSATELTELLVTCIDKNYADAWRVDVYDLIADGAMHQVPDFAMALKTLWTDYMMKLGSFPMDVNAYQSAPINTTFAFSDGLPDGHDPYLVNHLTELIAQNKPRADELLKLVKKFIEARKKWEEDKLVASSLSVKKIDDFRSDVLKGYKDRAIGIKVFDKAKKLKYVSRATNNYIMLGWNRVNDKEAFIDDWHSGYIMPGEEHGEEIATRQNQLIAEQLFNNPTSSETIENWLGHMRDTEDRWLIVSVEVSPWYIRQEFEEHLAKEVQLNDISFKNVNQFPMEHIYDKTLPKGLYAVNEQHLGTLKVKPADNEPVEVLVDAYSHNKELLDGMLNDPPQWLQDKGDQAEQEKFLKTKVRMYIYHSFHYVPNAKAKVFYFPLSDRY